MDSVPIYVSLVFILTTLIAVYLFFQAAHYSKAVLISLIIWMLFQAVLALDHFYHEITADYFYHETRAFPPRFPLQVMPPLLVIICFFAFPNGRCIIKKLDTGVLTLLHTIRIPVELVLYWLFLDGAVPELMTFTGRNFDILAGLTAPLVYYFGYLKQKLSARVILLWNIVALILLINIVVNALLSAPLPLQQFAFEQPNVAVLYFPFVWLPSVVVPIVLFSHLVCIGHLRWRRDLPVNRQG